MQHSTAQQLTSKNQKMSFRFEIIVLHNVVFSFVCLLFFFAIEYIFRSFVLSHQIEFAAVLNRSLATFNTMHTLYVIRFMCRLYVIRSMHIVYVIRFICKSCHPVYVQNMWHPVCSQIIRKLVFIQSVCHLVYWFIRRITFCLCHESYSIAYIQ